MFQPQGSGFVVNVCCNFTTSPNKTSGMCRPHNYALELRSVFRQPRFGVSDGAVGIIFIVDYRRP